MMDDNVLVSLKDSEGAEIGTATVGERPNTIVATGSSKESEYIIKILTGENSGLWATRALQQAIPSEITHNSRLIYRQPVEVEELADNFWLGNATYVSTKGLGEEDIPPDTYSFDTTGGTQHITNSNHTDRYGPGNLPDFKGAIGVTDNSVQGVDILVAGYKFGKTVSKDNKILTPQYLVALARLTTKVNDAPFLGFEAGEVLFLGATGSIEQINGINVEGRSDITMQFSANPNRENYKVGDITVAKKKGWDYQWVRYEYNDDDLAKKLIQKPAAVFIEEVYLKGSFSILGIEPTDLGIEPA